MRYKKYWCFHIPSGLLVEKQFADIAHHLGWDVEIGLSEQQALHAMNTWNRGSHHDYRYWIDL
jgi:hypothetical protein